MKQAADASSQINDRVATVKQILMKEAAVQNATWNKLSKRVHEYESNGITQRKKRVLPTEVPKQITEEEQVRFVHFYT